MLLGYAFIAARVRDISLCRVWATFKCSVCNHNNAIYAAVCVTAWEEYMFDVPQCDNMPFKILRYRNSQYIIEVKDVQYRYAMTTDDCFYIHLLCI